jgi:hypothetical protein
MLYTPKPITPRTIQTYLEALNLFSAFLVGCGLSTAGSRRCVDRGGMIKSLGTLGTAAVLLLGVLV